MPSRPPILVLPPTAAERIAAGEVVERPASVVKELIENSLDAGAHRITIEIEGSGSGLIRVVDDGEGIPAQDVPLAFERFATSKIRAAEDLARIGTYGFRGEALPSIAAVSRVEVVTRPPGQDDATRIVVVGGQRESLGPASGPDGTGVTVGDLFFNTPARREFLKSPARELAVIVETVEALAVAAPDVAFRLVETGREVLWYPPETFAARARRILGPSLADHVVDFVASGEAAALVGVIGTPQVAHPRRSFQWILVNRRPVRSPLLSRALDQAYHTLIPSDRYPVAVLDVRVPPEDVDVNIHPRKAEVRFARERDLFEHVVRAARQALQRVPLSHVIPVDVGRRDGDSRRAGVHPIATSAEHGPADEAAAAQTLWGPDPRTSPRWPAIRLIGQLALTYIVGEADGELVLIDQHAAHERVLFEHLRNRRAEHGVRSQGLVTPAVVELSLAERTLLGDLLPALGRLGFTIEPFGRATVRLSAVPAVAAARAPGDLFRACLRDLAGDPGPHAGRDLEERLAIATACHTAVRAGDPLDLAMMTGVLDALARAEDPFSCFHGRPTMVRVRSSELERWFYRRR
jgi:DNA mismatch repair protein MutL